MGKHGSEGGSEVPAKRSKAEEKHDSTCTHSHSQETPSDNEPRPSDFVFSSEDVYQALLKALYGLPKPAAKQQKEAGDDMEAGSDTKPTVLPAGAPEVAKTAASADVLIVGAGPAGLGVAVILERIGISYFVLEQKKIGATFESWPEETRFISPSFWSNPFLAVDLNAIDPHTSPCQSAGGVQHPNGKQYAGYLRDVVKKYSLQVHEGVQVLGITPPARKHTFESSFNGAGPRFAVKTNKGTLHPRFVIWAGGEYQYPNKDLLGKQPEHPASESRTAIHFSEVRSWRAYAKPGQTVIIAGGNESGADACHNLVKAGASVLICDPNNKWEKRAGDPSAALSPITVARLDEARETGRVQFKSCRVLNVRKTEQGKYVATVMAGSPPKSEEIESECPVVLATGFRASASLIGKVVTFDSDGVPALTKDDESEQTPGLFVVGPTMQHKIPRPKDGWPDKDNELGKEEQDKEYRLAIFCFIYKYRTRFAHVVHRILDRLYETHQVLIKAKVISKDRPPFSIENATKVLREYQKHGMKMSQIEGAQCACGC